MNNIANERKKLGISQNVLAASIGWKQTRLANYELNKRKPKLDDCRIIVKALKNFGSSCILDDIFPPK
ncbi:MULTISPECIES: helix-turn-helix domain-containing protein [Arsenophonus]|uniref:Helix-turn-helix transcriptional regulator n=1 Tax=Arsenophonus apicola TaxID=2879119 RepID=A0ABY8P1T7_9GAMM|nr:MULTISPECIES: helix-turn-helix transcriptional regulator [Arsenophonus]WGO83167.1 helix-turn-helix transcriptional regulator [Arsenophonus apicola]